jgi:hypothetical protein
MTLRKIHVFGTEEFGAARENESILYVEFTGNDVYPADAYRKDGQERTVPVSCETLGVYRGCHDGKLVIDPVFLPRVEIPFSAIHGWQISSSGAVNAALVEVAALGPLIERAAGSSASVEEKVACLVGLRKVVEENKLLLPFFKQLGNNTTL